MNEDVQDIDISIEQANKSIDKMNALNKLRDNKNFVDVIFKGYFEEEASRLVLMKAEPAMANKDDQEAIMKHIDAIGHLRQHFNTILQFGRMAEKAKEADEITREELLAEG
jgi:hypothetical protein